MDITLFVFLCLFSAVFGFLALVMPRNIWGLFSFIGAIIAIFTTATLGADGTLIVGYLNNAGVAVPITQPISTAIYVPLFLAIMDLIITLYKAAS